MKSDEDEIGRRAVGGSDVGFALDSHDGFLWLGMGVYPKTAAPPIPDRMRLL